MPTYLYRVGDDRIEVTHPMKEDPQTWGDLCRVSGLAPGERDPQEKVERLIVPVASQINQFTSDYKNSGFRRLEKRSGGVYEDVTAPKGERIIDVT